MEIAFTNAKSRFPELDLAFQVAAVDLQMRRDFAPAWGVEPWPCSAYRALPSQTDLFHPIFVMDDIGADALGYHDDVLNYIFGRVLTPEMATDATTSSHEAVEMRADPTCEEWSAMADGREVAKETGDPVEADAYPVTVSVGGVERGLLLSNFVLPAYFDPLSKGPWDFMGLLSGPAPAMTPGGYLILRDPRTGEISNIFSDRHAARHLAAKKADPTTRTARRIAKVARAMQAPGG